MSLPKLYPPGKRIWKHLDMSFNLRFKLRFNLKLYETKLCEI